MRLTERERREVGNIFLMYPYYRLMDIDYVYRAAKIVNPENPTELAIKITGLISDYGIRNSDDYRKQALMRLSQIHLLSERRLYGESDK